MLNSSFVLIGRLIVGLYFLVPGAIMKIFNYDLFYSYMLDHDVPFIHLALTLTIIIQLVCSIGVILGWYSKISAFALAMLTIIISYYMHDFWNMTSGMEQDHEIQNFVKNMGIMSGLLILSGLGPGKFSIHFH